MKRTMKLTAGLLTILLTSAACNNTTIGDGQGETNGERAALRVGTYDSRAVALAYGRSDRTDCMMAKVSQIRAQHAQAEKQGDQARMDALAAEAVAIQKKIHRQVFSASPIEDILKLLAKDLPKIAKETKVDLIADGVLQNKPDVVLVDVTLQMCAAFQPDAKTKKIIREIMAQAPIDESMLREDH